MSVPRSSVPPLAATRVSASRLDEIGEDELARRVDPVEQHDQQRDQQQVAVAQYQADAPEQAWHGPAVLDRDGTRAVGYRGPLGPHEEQCRCKQARRQDHQSDR